MQLSKPEQLNTMSSGNKRELPRIWSYSYDPRSGNDVAHFWGFRGGVTGNLTRTEGVWYGRNNFMHL